MGLLLLSKESRAQSSFVDQSFDIGAGAQNGFVESIIVQPDGKILACGNFQSFNNQPRSYIVRLNADGSVDTNFTAGVSYWVRSMALQPDGKVVIGGFFQFVSDQPRSLVARLNSDGSLDTNFNIGTGGTGILGAGIDGNANPFVFAIAVQNDGKILIGGNFAKYNEVGRRGIARLNSNGTLDTDFVVGSGVNSWVRSILVQPNEQIFVSGWFTGYNNHSRNRMVLLNPDGSVDENFNAVFGDQTAVYTMAPLPNGQLVVGGHTINPNSVFQQEVVRLNTNGTYDTTFNNGGSGATDKVESVVLQPDGKLLIAGYFGSYNGMATHNLARLNEDGTLDTTFQPNVSSWIWSVALQQDGKILICGGFSSVDGVPRSGVARLLSFPAPRLFQPKRFPHRFEVSVQTQTGTNYFLQYKNSWLGSNWLSLPPIIGDGDVQTLVDPEPSERDRFYRILQN